MLRSLCFLIAVQALGQHIQESMEIFSERDYRHRSNQIAPILVYDAEFFDRFCPRTVGDMLRRLPGMTGDGDAGEFSEIQMRGIGPDYTNVLIDGRPVPSGDHAGILFVDRIPASMVAQIEVVRSPTAGQDPNGIDGTINIKLKC